MTYQFIFSILDKYFKTCDRNSPEVNDCLVEAIQEGLVRLSDGLPELDVPPIDPYVQKEIRVEYKNNQVSLWNIIFFKNTKLMIIIWYKINIIFTIIYIKCIFYIKRLVYYGN